MFKDLPRTVKGAIILVLLGATVTVGLTVFSRYKLQLAHQNEVIADQLRGEAKAAKAEVEKFKATAMVLEGKLERANAKNSKLQAELDKIIVPPQPTQAPATTQSTLDELKNMGLKLVEKPSVRVAPCVVGLTQDDAVQVWFWGKDSLRVPFLEAKIEKSGEVIKGLEKAKGLAESLAEVKGKEAEAASRGAELHQKEADALRTVVKDTKSALNAEQKKKWLYTAGGVALTYLAVKR